MLHGITDCLLLEILRGWDVSKKVLLVPGMTTSMWENPMTEKQLRMVRRQCPWIKMMQPILWHDDDTGPLKCFVGWDGFKDLIDIIKNQAELMTIGHDIDTAALGVANIAIYNLKTDVTLPPEIWTLIFEYVGDWEISKALHVYVKIPIPLEWQRHQNERMDEFHVYMLSLEWMILTFPVQKIIEKLKTAPKGMQYLSSLCVKLIIKFCLTDLLMHLEANFKDVFWASFGQKLLPTKASVVYGRTDILEWWRNSPAFYCQAYTNEAIDGASKSGFVHVLDWWRTSGLPLKYTESTLEQASSKGHISVLEWWKQASLPPRNGHVDSGTKDRHESPSFAETEDSNTPKELKMPPRLLPGRSLLAAAEDNQPFVLRWWVNSGIPISHSESVAKIASEYGHVAVLDAWWELKGDEMAFDNQVLVAPTRNGNVQVLEWWKNLSKGKEGRVGAKVEYITYDIVEALQDGVEKEGGNTKLQHGGLRMG